MNKIGRYGTMAWVFALYLISCGAPFEPVTNTWRREAELPGQPFGINVAGLAATSNGVFVAVTRYETRKELVILRYYQGVFEEDWLFAAGADGGMAAISKIGSVLWAGGTRTESGLDLGYIPVLVRKIGSSGWEKVDLGSNARFGGIGRVFAISKDSCWLLTADNYPSRWYGALVKYENGSCRSFPVFPYVTAAYDAANDTLYVIRLKKGNYIEVAITRDGGSSWLEESAVLEAIPGADVAKADILPPVVYDGDLIFPLRPAAGGSWTAIYRRTGEPGAGDYKMVFYSNLGPYFRFVDHLAVDSMARFVGVGTDTCLVYDGSNWLLEKPPYVHTSFNSIAAAAETGFYATAYNETTEKLELLFHP